MLATVDPVRFRSPLRSPVLAQAARDVSVVAVAACIGSLAFVGAEETRPQPSTTQTVRDLAIGIVACLILLVFRRRRPVAVTLVLTVMAVFSGSAWGTPAMGVFTVALHCSWRATALVTALNGGFIVFAFTVVPGMGRQERVEAMSVFLSMYVALVATGLLVRSRRQLIESLKERARQAEEGQRLRVEEARHLERERIAREMHDVLAHRISLLAVHAGALEFHADAPPEQREAAGIIRRSAYEAMEDLRQVIGMLRDAPPEDTGESAERPPPALTDLPALIEESRRAGTHVTLDDRVPDPDQVPSRIGRHAYRIVQEGLTNARKHAPGALVRVTVAATGAGGLSVEIVNPLPPGPAVHGTGLPGAGMGLVGLRERVTMLGGELEHGRTDDGRFRLHATLPPPVGS
ncbi:two-component sensor histidine kinase [Actinomadura sp. NBRC 104412]|nr:two-component sensor histidine kinase [Actinomadura sp. NBRC 104412]